MLIVMFYWLRRWLIGALAVVTVTGSALACSCGPPVDGRTPSQEAFDEASFVGLVTLTGTEYAPASPFCGDRHRPNDCKPRKMGVFKIESVLKGSAAAPIRISLEYSQCMVQGPYDVGEQAWIAAFGDPEVGYSFGDCRWFEPPSKWNGDPVADAVLRYQGLREGLEGAVQRRPEPGALMELAHFLAETHSRLEAISVLDKVLAMDRLHSEANVLKARQLAIGPSQQTVIDSLAPYLAEHPEDQEAVHQQVLALVRLDRLSEVPSDWRDFTGLSGLHYDFSNRALDGASFRSNIVYETSFVGSNLRKSDFSNAHLGFGDFSGADLTGANLTGAELGQVNFRGAVLDGADLSGAYLGRADLRGASLKGANLSKAYLGGIKHDEATIWPDGFEPKGVGAP
jgi:hypothetical protein